MPGRATSRDLLTRCAHRLALLEPNSLTDFDLGTTDRTSFGIFRENIIRFKNLDS